MRRVLSGASQGSVFVSNAVVLAMTGRLIVSTLIPGSSADARLREALIDVLEGAHTWGEDVVLDARLLAVLYGGVVLSHASKDGRVVTPISRALPDYPVRVTRCGASGSPRLGVDELLDAWAALLRGERWALRLLGSCSMEPRGIRLEPAEPGQGEPLPPIGFRAILSGGS